MNKNTALIAAAILMAVVAAFLVSKGPASAPRIMPATEAARISPREPSPGYAIPENTPPNAAELARVAEEVKENTEAMEKLEATIKEDRAKRRASAVIASQQEIAQLAVPETARKKDETVKFGTGSPNIRPTEAENANMKVRRIVAY